MRERLRKTDDAGLGRDHVRAVCRAGVAGQAADIDDAAAIAFRDMLERRMRGQIYRIETDTHHQAPVGVGHLSKRFLRPDGRIVDQDIEPSESGGSLTDNTRGGRRFGEIAHDQQCLGPERLYPAYRFGGGLAVVGRMHGDMRAVTGKRAGDCTPDIA